MSAIPFSESDADACVEQVARTYLAMPYEQLKSLALASDGAWLEIERDCHGMPIHLTILMGYFGRFRKRVSVEIIATPERGQHWEWTPCAYLERDQTGRVHFGTTLGMTSVRARRQRRIENWFIGAALLLVAAGILALFRLWGES